MDPQIIYSQPDSLMVGLKYKLEIKKDNSDQSSYEDVIFFSCTSSPEAIIVETENGQRLRVFRYSLYEMKIVSGILDNRSTQKHAQEIPKA